MKTGSNCSLERTPKRRALAGVSLVAILVAGAAQAQSPGPASPLPPITVQEPQRTQRQAAPSTRPARVTRAPVRRAASRQPTPAAPPQTALQRPLQPTSAMSVPPSFAGGQVARGGQVGVLGNLDYMSTPFSSQNFTRQFIQNTQSTQIQDVLLADPSVSLAQGGSRGALDYGRFRGFPSYTGTDAASVNGLAGVSMYVLPPPEMLERIELIKGANAFLNGGVGAVGGSVNLVTKRATDRPIAEATLQYGSRGQVGGAVDAGGRWGDSKEFGLRINGLHREGALAPDGTDSRQSSVAVGWDYRGERFRMDADLVYTNQIFYGDPYYTTLADPTLGLPKPPPNRVNLTAPWMYNAAESVLVMTRAEYDINNDWTVAASYGHSASSSRFNSYCFNTVLNLAGDATCGGNPSKSTYDRDAANVALRGILYTGPVKHRLAFGGNFIREDQAAQPNLPGYSTIDFNIYAPVWPAPADPAFGPTVRQNLFVTQGGFVADTMSVLDERLNLTLGGRQTRIDQNAYDIASGLQTSQSSTSATTPVIGALVKVTPWLSLYGSYIEALERGGIAPAFTSNAGTTFKPLVGKQYEGGAKLDFKTIGATFAYFDITKASEFTDFATNTYVQNGKQQHRGVEVTVFGEPLPGVRFLTGASWIDAVLVSTEGGLFDGKKAPAVPRYELRLTGEVDLPFVPGATLTAAVYHSGPAPFDSANTLDVPAWTRLDLGARYVTVIDGTKFTGRFKVENVTDEAYWIAGYGSGGLSQSGARRYLASVTAAF